MGDGIGKEEEDELEDFFREVEKLTISTAEEQQQLPSAEAKDNTARQRKTNKNTRIKEEAIGRAETGRQSWQEFSTSSSDKQQDRPLVSFSLKSKGRKPKAKQRATERKDSNPLPPPLLVQKPHWIAVLDTCVLLESSLDDIYDLVSTAVHAAETKRPNSFVEPITVLIPYTVWTELDYRSKEEDEDTKFRARRAVRMLNTELAHHRSNEEAVIRSQSRADLAAATREFSSASTPINNDDHILFCARAEQQHHTARNNATAGGVVLLTHDKVLTGKARADGVVVDAPGSFVEYYRRRTASLRDRSRQGIR